MKNNIKTIWIFGALSVSLLMSISAKAQTYSATYEYDANGNRTLAKVVYLSQTSSPTSPKVEEIITDENKSYNVNIYPNPTRGNLIVEIIGATSEELDNPKNSIIVWDLQGRLLLTINPIGYKNLVDLSEQINGIYLMKLILNGKEKQFKIVKN